MAFDLDLDIEYTLDAGPCGTIMCKFGGDQIPLFRQGRTEPPRS